MEENRLICNEEYTRIFEELETEKLSSKEVEFVNEIIFLFYPLFALHSFETFPQIRHYIDTINHLPFQESYNPITSYSQHQKEDLLEQIDHLLYAKIFEKSTSPYNNKISVRLVWIPHTQRLTYKFGTDFTTLNLLIRDTISQQTTIEDIRIKINDAKKISIIDLMDLYSRIEINPSDTDKTSFITPVGTYKFTRLAPSIKNAEKTFLKFLEIVFPPTHRKDIIFFPKGILITSKNLKEHQNTIKTAFNIFSENGITIQAAQCKFFVDKIDAHDFIDNEFETEIPEIITYPIYSGQLILYFQILKEKFRTILAEYTDNEIKYITKSSRTFQPIEKNYSYHEKVCLTLVHARRRFNEYIGENSILLPHGHDAFDWLANLNITNSRLYRWILELTADEWILVQYN